MKKKIFLGVFALALLATVGFGVKKSMMSSDAGLSDLALANVEALAQGEGGGINRGDPCYSDGNYNADKPSAVVCGNPCKYLPWAVVWFPKTSYCP